MPALSREEVRAIDAQARDAFGIPTLLLMENAGAGLARVVREHLHARGLGAGTPVVIVCGRGGNGGDGLVLARHLALAGLAPRVALAAAPETFDRGSDAGINLGIVERLGSVPIAVAATGEALAALLGRWRDSALLADALLGTGVSEEIREPHRGLIAAMNASGLTVAAVDLPSGLDADTGAPLGVAVHAAFTVTFAGTKKGFEAPGARAFTGPVTVVGIGAPGSEA